MIPIAAATSGRELSATSAPRSTGSPITYTPPSEVLPLKWRPASAASLASCSSGTSRTAPRTGEADAISVPPLPYSRSSRSWSRAALPSWLCFAASVALAAAWRVA